MKHAQKQLRTKVDYYVTGDQAHIDNDGYFWFEGRRDDIIIIDIPLTFREDALSRSKNVQLLQVLMTFVEILFLILQDVRSHGS